MRLRRPGCWSRQRAGQRRCSQFENNYFTEICSGSEAGSSLRLIDFVYHSTLGLRVIKKKKEEKRVEDEPASGKRAPGVSAY